MVGEKGFGERKIILCHAAPHGKIFCVVIQYLLFFRSEPFLGGVELRVISVFCIASINWSQSQLFFLLFFHSNFIFLNTEDGLKTGVLVWDLSLAFDTLDPDLLCQKLAIIIIIFIIINIIIIIIMRLVSLTKSI